MSPALIPVIIVAGFLLFFAGMWIGITSLLLWLAGWAALERRFPDTGEPARRSVKARWATMGAGVKFQRALTVSACHGGLRVEIGALLGRGHKPFLVPWGEIREGKGRAIFARPVRLGLGVPEAGQLTLQEEIWAELRAGRR